MAEEQVPALSPQEQSTWRALTYVANHLVKALGEDLAREMPLSVSEYMVLAHLSEADDQQLRIGDLAAIGALSPSRMSRLVDAMAAKGMVTKTRTASDSRCTLATLTPVGFETLKAAYPTQLRNVRRRVFDYLTEDEVAALGTALTKIRASLESAGPSGHDRRASASERQPSTTS